MSRTRICAPWRRLSRSAVSREHGRSSSILDAQPEGRRYRVARAQNLVEFAIIGPLFFLMLFGVIEGGRLVFTNHEIANGTREGARYAMVHGSKSGSPATNGAVESAAEEKMAGITNSKYTAVIEPLDGNLDPGSRVRVTGTYTYTPIISMVFGAGDITLTHTSTVIIQH